jgi:DNA-binding MarR family transcriptional regulator
LEEVKKSAIREPIGRTMANIGRIFLLEIQQNLSNLDIERSFYPLLLIEAAEGKINQQDLARKLNCDKVQVVRIIDYLSSSGYVKRNKDQHDRRKYNLEITEKARKSLPKIKTVILKTTKKAFKNIPENKVEELYTLLLLMENNLKTGKKE